VVRFADSTTSKLAPMATMSEDHIFVYGTLRRGGVREMSRLLPRCRDLGPATLRGVLHDFGAYPGLRLDEDGVVHGEIYTVDAEALALLDDIERFLPDDYEASYYFRHRVVAQLADGASIECWVYEFNPKYYGQRAPITSGDWIAYAAQKGALPEESWPDGKKIRNS
jgi:gamma-glutamylcyclotransferase (GGCT)/AIG2-like uncharacterized protein YtfP